MYKNKHQIIFEASSEAFIDDNKINNEDQLFY